MIPEIIKQKINAEIEIRYPDFKDTKQEIDFRNSTEYGYSLAESEIKRLKGLLERQFLINLRGWGNEDQRKQVLQEFKTDNQL